MVTGAWISTFIYNAGKALADVAGKRVTNGALEWLAGVCERADFVHFYHASLILAAIVLLLPFSEWFKRERRTGENTGDPLPLDGVRATGKGQRFLNNPRGPLQLITGFGVIVVMFSMIVGVAILLGALQLNVSGSQLPKILGKAIFLAVALACLQEFLFRGVVMGAFLRAMRPATALGLSALLFAFVHFLIPDPSLSPADPEASGAGIEVLNRSLGRLGETNAVIGILVPYLALGILLGFSRWRTSSLWLPVGIHTGWLFSQLLMQAAVSSSAVPDGSFPHASALQGLIILAGVVAAGFISIRISTPHESAS